MRPFLFSLTFLAVSLSCIHSSVAEQYPADSTDPDVLMLGSAEHVASFEFAWEAYLDFKLDEADRRFRILAAKDGGEAAAYLYLSSISMYRFIMTDEDHYEEEFLQRSDSLKQMLDEIEDGPWRIFIGAEANMQRAVVRTKRGKYLRAALAARSAYNEYSRVVADDPKFYEAYKGLGLLHLTFEYAPAFYQKFLKMLGYSSAPGQGLAELQLAADSSRYNQEEARVMLGVLDVILFGSQRNGEEMLRTAYNQHPENPMFSHVLGFYLYSNRRVDEAIELFRESADRYDDPDYFFIDYTDQFLATCYFYRGDYEESIFYNRRYIENHPGPAVKAPANLNTGLALELLGRRNEAIPYYRAVKSSREFDVDAVAQKLATELVDAPLTDNAIILLKAYNALQAGMYETSGRMLEDFLKSGKPEPNQVVEATYSLARVRHAQGRRAGAFELYQQVIDMPRDPDTRWAPWAEYYRGVMFEEDGLKRQARFAYERAMSYDGNYDYKQSVQDLSKLAIKRLQLEI